MNWTVHCADVLAWCEDYAAKIERGEEFPFHGILTDPSYGLGDNPDIEALLTAWMAGEDYDTGPGFMQRDWDQLPSPRYWRALRRCCHPGAYLFAFGGTRTADLLSVAIRLGGWERFDSIDSLSWTYASGFPKSTAIDKKVDSAAGMEREVVGKNSNVNGRISGGIWADGIERHWKDRVRKGDISNANTTAPASSLSARFDGWGTATKPAHEPILAFRNPLAKVPSDRIHAVTGWDWWHSEKLLKDTPQTRLKMLKKYGCWLPPLYGEADLVLITRKALHEDVETDKLFVARTKRQWREAPTEPVTLARVDVKAYRRWSSKTYAANCLSTGAGALNIDGSRVTTGEGVAAHRNTARNDIYGKFNESYQPGDNGKYVNTQGRWPPNCALVHVPPRPDGNGGWLPGCERLGVKRVGSGEQKKLKRSRKGFKISGSTDNIQEANAPDAYGEEEVTAYACVLACDPSAGSGRGCGHQWTAEQRGACPECGGEARWACAVGELAEQSGELKTRPAKAALSGEGSGDGHSPNNGWGMKSVAISGYADQGTAARFYPQFEWQHEIAERLAGVVPFYYCAKSARRERDAGLDGFEYQQGFDKNTSKTIRRSDPDTGVVREFEYTPSQRRNPHPTVKPLSLLVWLSKLIAPPPEYAPRRLLIPFSGSGSECAAAVLSQNWETVVGIEMDESYCDIARARLRFWADWAARGYDEPAAILKAAKREETRREEAQMELL